MQQQRECDPIKPASRGTKLVAAVLGCLILAGGIGLGVRFVRTKPVPPQATPAPIAPLVSVALPEPYTGAVSIPAMGTVTAARKIELRPQVTGVIDHVSPRFEPGAVVPKGHELVRLEAKDFELAVASRQAELEQAKAELLVESGRQEVARHEWTLADPRHRGQSSALALREPQWAAAKAMVRKVESQLQQNQLDLSRTRITAPFPALILETNAHLGSRVGVQDSLATLVDASEFWVEGTVSAEQLRWFSLPSPTTAGAQVTIISPQGVNATGQIIQLRADVEPQGRLARILISLPRPLTHTPPFLLGEYVQVRIQGHDISNAVRLPRRALRDGDVLWTVTQNSTLAIQPARVLWGDADHILVADVSAQTPVITSALPAPVIGMRLTILEQSSATTGARP